MTLIRAGIIMVLLASTCGCVVGGVATISEPHVEEHAASMGSDNGIVYLDGLSISVRPQNVDVGVLTGGILVPVIPLGGGNRVDTRQPFKIVVQFETERIDFTFDPFGVLLETGDIPIHPSKAFGPVDGGFPLSPLYSNTPGHRWGCDSPSNAPDENEAIDRIAIAGKQCVVAQFPVNTIDPGNDFAVTITGLYTYGNAVEPIKMRFSKANKVVVEILSN